MIRNASTKDSDGISQIYNYYIQNSISSFEESPVSVDDMAGRIKKTKARFPFLVSEKDGKIKGFAYATDWKNRSAYKFTVETSVYVDPNETEKGIGKALYLELTKLLRKYGFKNAIASIALPNDASIFLHEQLGFKKAGILKKVGLKFGQSVDVGYWQLTL